jgi:folylpolyglutamate synthase/dihydropteroate synthase
VAEFMPPVQVHDGHRTPATAHADRAQGGEGTPQALRSHAQPRHNHFAVFGQLDALDDATYFSHFEAVASIWFNGSCEANHNPDHSEATMAEDAAEGQKDAIRVDTAELRGHVDAVVRSSVEKMCRRCWL